MSNLTVLIEQSATRIVTSAAGTDNVTSQSRQFYNSYHSFVNLLHLFIASIWHILTVVVPRRLKHGPTRRRWTWTQEIAVQVMQFQYKWNLDRQMWYNAMIDVDTPKIYDPNMLTISSTEDVNRKKRMGNFCVESFQHLINYLLPTLPYWPFAHHSLVHLKSPMAYDSFPMDIVTHKSLEVTHIRGLTMAKSGRVILMVHGGAFCFRVQASYHQLALHYSNTLNATVVIPQYRLAPKHPYPAALDDVITTYRWLIQDLECDPTKMTFLGESAGAGCIVGSLLRMRQMFPELPKPACVYLQSPWIDLTCGKGLKNIPSAHHAFDEELLSTTAGSWKRNAASDILHSPVFPFDLSLAYAGSETILTHPHASPWFATDQELSDALPRAVLVQVGGRESLVDEGVALVRRLTMFRRQPQNWLSNIESRQDLSDESLYFDRCLCQVYQDMTHVFQLFMPLGHATAIDAISRGCSFIDRNL